MKNTCGFGSVKQLLKVQFIMSLLISSGLLLYDKQEAWAALLGGIVAIIPSYLFAAKLFQSQGARAAREIVRGFYIGEALKIFSTIILFTLAFSLFKIAPLPFFTTYIVVLMMHWFAPLIFANKVIRRDNN